MKMYLMNIHVVGVRLAKQRMTVLTCGGVEQSRKKRKNQHNEEIQTKKPTKINHFLKNVFKCVLIVKKKQRKSFF